MRKREGAFVLLENNRRVWGRGGGDPLGVSPRARQGPMPKEGGGFVLLENGRRDWGRVGGEEFSRVSLWRGVGRCRSGRGLLFLLENKRRDSGRVGGPGGGGGYFRE